MKERRFRRFAAAIQKLEPIEIIGVAKLLGVSSVFDKEETDDEKAIGDILIAFKNAPKDKQMFLLEVLRAAVK